MRYPCSSFFQSVHNDFKSIFHHGQIPDHVEVALRVSASCFLAFVLGAGDGFYNFIPQSQRYTIAMLVPTLSMLFPTYMFSIGAILVPAQLLVIFIAYVFATMLLACVAGVGVNLYVAMYGITALIVSGARFDHATAAMTTLHMMNVALNTISLVPAAEASAGGMDFVKSLWTETGIQNPNAIFWNGLVGMAWILFLICVGRIIPPFRTSRSFLTDLLLPGVLHDMADYILLNYEPPSDKEGIMCSLLALPTNSDKATVDAAREKRRDELRSSVIAKKAMLNNGAIAGMTAFEPRLLRFGPPECSYAVLAELCRAVDRCAVSTMAVDSIFRHHLDEERKGVLAPIHVRCVENLRLCAEALKSHGKGGSSGGKGAFCKRAKGKGNANDDAEMKDSKGDNMVNEDLIAKLAADDRQDNDKVEDGNKAGTNSDKRPDDAADDTADGGTLQPKSDIVTVNRELIAKLAQESTTTKTKTDNDNKNNDGQGQQQVDEDADLTSDGRFDTLHLTRRSREVVSALDKWFEATSLPPPNRWNVKSYFDQSARRALKLNLKPWFMSSFGIWVVVTKNMWSLRKGSLWRSICGPPYNNQDTKKFIWCIKFAIGFVALVSMSVYWDAFASIIVPTKDNDGAPVTPHFSGWYLIAYSMSTTQTTEGTTRKGILRLIGTAFGGFSGWLALTACGTRNAVGLIAWATCITFVACYSSLGRGPKARMGVDSDYGYATGTFSMTQALVIFDVYLGNGGKNDITVNRIVANCVGIATAIFLAVIPPGWYGGDPQSAREVLHLERQVLSTGLKSLIERGDEGPETLVAEIEELRAVEKVRGGGRLSEAKSFYADGQKLQKLPRICAVDPALERALDGLASVGSFIYALLSFVQHLLKHDRQAFLQEGQHRDAAEYYIRVLDSEASLMKTTADEVEGPHLATDDSKPEICNDSDLFLWYVGVAVRALTMNQERLSEIKYGFFS